ncbi:MAG: TonB-dependent receptor [Flavobacteriaceae bacterium]|nr:TonB-dependent receptor [Flavobacteriaceae bacterium]MCY4266257.1 TonB-dependent receptor [Flavobacteriaceae bacterium]
MMSLLVKLIITLGAFGFGILGHSQTILVKDRQTGDPLESVVIIDSQLNSTITNVQGIADISDLNSGELLTVSRLGYRDYQFVNDSSQINVLVLLEQETDSLNEIVLSVARSEISRDQIAEKVSVTSKRDIEFSRPSTGAELIKLSPGIRLQKSQGGGGSPILRGLEGNRILMVIDGVRMNNAIYRSGHHQYALSVDPHTIERVEVTFGSSSVGYGSDGLGGVIHYYTKSPRLDADGYNNFQINSNFSTADKQIINNVSLEWGFEKWGSLTSLTYSDFGDIKMGRVRNHGFENWGLVPYYSRNNRDVFSPYAVINSDPLIQRNSGYQQLDVFQKFIYQLDSDYQLSFNLQFSTTSDVPRFDRLAEMRHDYLRFSEWYYGPQKRFLLSGQFKFFPKWSLLDKGMITLGYQNIKESRISRLFTSLKRNIQEEDVDVYSFNADFDFNLNRNHKFSYGIETTLNAVNSFALAYLIVFDEGAIDSHYNPNPTEIKDYIMDAPIIDTFGTKSIPSRYPSDYSYLGSLAAYANWVWNFNPKFSLNAGIRMNYVEVFAKWNDIANVDALLSQTRVINRVSSETISLIYRPSDQTQWNFILSSGFRSPNIDDLGKIRQSGSNLLVPNDFLKAEYAYNLDLGLDKRFHQSSNYISLRVYGTILSRHIGRDQYQIIADFSTEDINTIIYNDQEINTISNKNLGDRYLYGATFDSRVTLFKKIDLLSSLTYTEGVKHDIYGPLPSISPLFGSAHIQFNHTWIQALLGIEFSDAKDYRDYSLGGEDGLEETPFLEKEERYHGTPAWMTVNFNSQVQVIKNASIKLGLENIFDIHYKPFASGISSPGRNFKVGLQYQF